MNILFSINGRIGRRQYLCTLLLTFVVWMILFLCYLFYFDVVLKLKLSTEVITAMAQPSLFLLMIVPIVKRLHDINASGWWLVGIYIIATILDLASWSNPPESLELEQISTGARGFFGFILLLAPGTKGKNDYGERKSFFKKKNIVTEPDPITVSTLDDIKHLELKSDERGEMIFTAEPEEQLKQPETLKHHFIMPVFSNFQKLNFCFSFISVIMLIMACNDRYDIGFYIFLRIVTCIALIGLCFDRFSVWIKFILIMAIILYNPIIKISMDRSDWEDFNVLTIGLLMVLQAIIIIREMRNGTSASREE